eukprot:gene10369-8308_t
MAMSVVSRASSMRVATQACRKVVKASPLLRSAAPVRPRQRWVSMGGAIMVLVLDLASCHQSLDYVSSGAAVNIFAVGVSAHCVVVAADSDDDAVTRILSKFEASDKKAVVAGYAIGGLAAIFLLEWVMHLPLLNASNLTPILLKVTSLYAAVQRSLIFVLSFSPVQLVGLIMLPVLVTRYALDGKDLEKDIESSLGDITKKLPGLSKE